MPTKVEYILKTVLTLAVIAAASVAIVISTYKSPYFLTVYFTVLCQFLGLSCFLFEGKYLPHVITVCVSVPVFGVLICLYARFAGAKKLKKLKASAQLAQSAKNSDNGVIAPLFGGNYPVCGGEGAKLYFDGKDFFADMLCEIESAKESVYIVGYLFREGYAAEELCYSLEKALDRGAKVVFVADYYGGASFFRSQKYAKLAARGAKCVFFNKAGLFITFADNFRLHSKACVIDRDTAFLSSLNVGDEFLFEEGNYGVKFFGDGATFVWEYANKLSSLPTHDTPYFVKNEGSIPADNVIVTAFTAGGELYRGVVYAFTSAKFSVKIISPYVSVDQGIKECFKTLMAAGVEIKLIVPPRSGVKKPRAGEVYYSVNDLIDLGVKVYETRNFIHSKMMIIDDEYLIIGSANLDLRSLTCAAESTLVMSDKSKVFSAVKKFDGLCAASKRVERQTKKGAFYLACRNAFKFFAPLV